MKNYLLSDKQHSTIHQVIILEEKLQMCVKIY